jgi:hypothetical protein
MKSRLLQAAGFTLLGCVAWQAQAGTVIQQVERAVGNSPARQTVTIYLDAGKLRVEGENPGAGKYLLIFDNARQVLWMADLARGSYMEITKAQVEAMGGQMQQMMQQMQAQLAQIPPEQRAMVEQMMRQQMGNVGGNAPPPVTVREKNRGETVGSFTCTRYEVLTGGQVTEEVCAAAPSQLKLDDSAFETFKALAEFFEPLARMAPRGGWSAPKALDQIDGFPVQTVLYEGQRPASEWVILKAEEQAVDAALFTLPGNLRKTEMPQMPQR